MRAKNTALRLGAQRHFIASQRVRNEGEPALLPPTALNTAIVLLAQAGQEPANGPGDWVYIVLILTLGLLAGGGMMLLFLYASGRLAIGTANKIAASTAQAAASSLEATGEAVKSVAKSAAEGAGAIGRAMSDFAETRSAHSVYLAIAEARASFEIVTCKMSSIVYHKMEEKSWSSHRVLVEVMPIEIGYGFDMESFGPDDISVENEGETLRITLPPIKVLSLQKGGPQTVYTNYKTLPLEQLRACQESLDARMRETAKSPKSLSIAEEISRGSFRELIKTLFYLVEEERRPKHIEVQIRPRDQYELSLPAPLQLESHHLPDTEKDDDIIE